MGVCEPGDGGVRDQSGPATNTPVVDPPARVFDFELISEGVGWSVPDSFSSVPTPSVASSAAPSATTSYNDARFCYARCAYRPECAAFTVQTLECRLHTRTQALADAIDHGDLRTMYRKTLPNASQSQSQIRDQSGPECGEIGLSCCYGEGTTEQASLCGAGDCEPSAGVAITGTTESRGTDTLPCLCSSAVCVANLDFCPIGGVCDQSATIPACGAMSQECCAGDACDEEGVVDGEITGLICSDGLCEPYLQ